MGWKAHKGVIFPVRREYTTPLMWAACGPNNLSLCGKPCFRNEVILSKLSVTRHQNAVSVKYSLWVLTDFVLE
ncbi:rCG20437 [Rattus norvegicus]|uniref:RCG20437 n=1 Tax=Rattus norvegicus TaxID=10116 RepID=A6JH08_RAT|nr:rCG20437 [Rattus norvegicus]